MSRTDPRKSGQAIIFLMVVLVIGILAVIWNFDLHRVITGKLRMRNAGDAAALAAARWQGHTLNMIGDLNLIQAALIADSFEIDSNGVAQLVIPPEAFELQELRHRLEFVGPLAAFAVAQQTAFNNRVLPDPDLASNLFTIAETIRDQINVQPYDNAFDEYADLLTDLASRGVAVGSYTLSLPNHPLVDEAFYTAIAEATADWWCGMEDYRYQLENYFGYDSWSKLDTEFDELYIFDLMLDEHFTSGFIPDSALATQNEFNNNFGPYLDNTYPNEILLFDGDDQIGWHVYGQTPRRYSWERQWPRPAEYGDEVTADTLHRRLAIRDHVKSQYNYLGAVAGISMNARVSRGILSSSGNETIDLSYRAKAKPFGFLNIDDGLVPPNYFGYVLPCFQDVRLVHSDIGQKVLSTDFYNHITRHLEPYLEGGPEATDVTCPYCRLLAAWENLDRKEGLEWLDRAYNDPHHNPCDPDDDMDESRWGDDGGGATGGS